MIRVGTGELFTAVVTDGTPGLVGTISFKIIDSEGAEILAETTTGIIELAPGTYARTQNAPDGTLVGLVVWDEHITPDVLATEELRVYYSEPAVPGRGVLPFRRSGGRIQDRAGTDLMVVDFDVWRSSTTSGGGGQIDLWAGICSARAAPVVVGKANRVLLGEGVKFRIEDAIFHDLLGYVELTLRDPRAQG